LSNEVSKYNEITCYLPLSTQILSQFLIRSNVNAPGFTITSARFLLLTEQPQNREFRTDSFTGPSGSADEYVIVRVVQRIEHLRLDGVELSKWKLNNPIT